MDDILGALNYGGQPAFNLAIYNRLRELEVRVADLENVEQIPVVLNPKPSKTPKKTEPEVEVEI
jgi:hypothetical protein